MFLFRVCGHNGFDIIDLLLVSPCFYVTFYICLSIDTPLYWFGLGLLFTTAFSVYVGFWPKVAYMCLPIRVLGLKSHTYADVLYTVAYILPFGESDVVGSARWVVSVVGSSLGLVLSVGCLFCDQRSLFHWVFFESSFSHFSFLFCH